MEHRIIRSFMNDTPVHLMEISTKFDYVGRACSIHRKEEKYTLEWGEKQKGNEVAIVLNSEDGRII